MFKQLIPLRAEEHGELRLAETTDWRFAAQEMVVPIVFTEMADAAREYPLIFLKDKPLVCALTGVEQGVNAYIDGEGRWVANYIPARLRAYPFNLGNIPGKPNEFAIVFDAEAPQLLSAQGSLLFKDGQPSDFLNRRTELLKNLHRAEAATRSMVETIRSAGLLVDRSVRMQRRDKQDLHVGGMQVVDEKKLNQLPHEAFARLRDKGVLALIYAHLLSMANLRQGVIGGKYPQLRKQADEQIEQLMQSETIRFN